MNRHWPWVAAVLISWSLPVTGQSGLGIYGFGMVQPPADITSQSIGNITAIPVDASEYLYTLPASWQNIRSTQLHGAVSLDAASFEEQGGYHEVMLRSIQFLVHVNSKTAYGIAIRPVTRVDATLQYDTLNVLFGDSIRYSQSQTMKGGLSSLTFGISRRVIPSLALGLSVDILFGSLASQDQIEFLNADEIQEWYLFSQLNAERRFEFNGHTVRLSLLTKAFPKERSELGVQVMLPIGLNVSEQRLYPQNLPEENIWHSGRVLPEGLDLGYRFDLNPRQRVMAGMEISRTKDDPLQDIIFGQHVKGIRRLSAGWSRGPGRPDALLFDRLNYRVGFYQIKYYLSSLYSDPKIELGLTFGSGYQAPRSGQRFDLGMQFGRRQGFLPGIPHEYFYRLSIGVTTSELWFVRPNKKW